MCKQPAAAPFPLRVGYMYATCLLGVRPSLPRAFNSSSRHSNIEVWVCVPNRNRMATHEFRIRIDSSELTIDRGVAVHYIQITDRDTKSGQSAGCCGPRRGPVEFRFRRKE